MTPSMLIAAEPPDPVALAADDWAPVDEGIGAYWSRPDLFVLECFEWPEGQAPTDYQLSNMRAVVEHKRVAVRGPHGLGKTAENAWMVLWFALTREAREADWKVPTTASAWRQLTHYLWPEVHKWAKRLKWEQLGRAPFDERYELQTRTLKLRHGEAFAVASNDPATIEGVHADQVLYIYDEAKTIPVETWDASEGAFSGAGTDTRAEAFALASSTPGPPTGRFYEIHKQQPGLEDWHAIHVTLQDAIDAGRVSSEWATQRKKQWGAKSAVYLNRVEGKFAASDEDSVIPLAWVEEAQERWRTAETDGGIDALGVDVAREGGDKTVIAPRRGNVLIELRRYDKQSTMQTANRLDGIMRGTDIVAVIDVIGVGGGVVDRVRELGHQVIAFNASRRTDMLDSSGELGFVNQRAASWWNLREMLDPDSGLDVALPDDDLLTGDLTTPTWRVMSGGRIQVESKDDIKKRLGRSPDDGDAAVMAFWPGEWEPEDEIVEYDGGYTIGPDI